jgi:hypothetical protein
MFFACGSQDDGSPAALISKDLRISPFETLVVEFNSNIVDLGSLKVGENIILSKNVEWVTPKETASNKLKFIGKNLTAKGSPYFNPGVSDRIEFKNLKNSEGYIMENAALSFSTLDIIDDIKDYENRNKDYPIELDSYFRNKEAIEFAGILDHKIEDGTTNFDDYYSLKLRTDDKLTITVTFRSPLTVQLISPEGKNINFLIPSFAYTVTATDLNLNKDDPAGMEVSFYIKISDESYATMNAEPNPYTLTISRSRNPKWD